MHKSILTALILAAITLTASGASAQSRTLPISGTLTDSDGKLLEGTHEVLITLHEQDAGDDTPLASQRFNVTGALMAVHMDVSDRVLGDAVSGKLNYLEVTIDGEVQTPRIRLGSVPRALVADVALSAQTALVADNASRIAGKEPAQFISEQLLSTAVWTSEYPILIRGVMGRPVIGFESCPEGSTWVVVGGIWQCAKMPAPKPSPTIDVAQDGTLSVKTNSLTGNYIKDGAITNNHILSNAAIDPTKIAGQAAILNANGNQNFHSGTFVIGQGAVGVNMPTPSPGISLDVNGPVRSSSFQRATTLTKTLRIPAAHFISGTGPSVSTPTAWAIHRDGFGYIPTGAPSRIASLTAPLPTDLPEDTTFKTLRCHYGASAGSISTSYAEIIARRQDSATVTSSGQMTFLAPASTFGSVSMPITGTNTVAAGRYQLVHVWWAHTLPSGGSGQSGQFLGCELEYTTSRL